MTRTQPRVIIAALKGGSGKTILTMGLVSAWREKGCSIAPFKKGPDFIDAGWLSFSARRECHNLDNFLMTNDQILSSFFRNSNNADVALIEGNRGLYDGLDVVGSCSTAALAKLLRAPVVIIVDVTMATRTVAAMIKGCQAFDPDLNIAGVILNRVAGPRQEKLIRDAVVRFCGIPVVGAVPRLKHNPFPERHMGLVPFQERSHAEKAISRTRNIVQENLRMDEIWKIAHQADSIHFLPGMREEPPRSNPDENAPRIGFIRDNAFWFYYPENLDQLRHMGAELVEISAISDRELPHLDALYMGGGFPETQAQALTDNSMFRESLKERIEEGLPVYAECGGFMYLGKSLVVHGNTYPMAGVLPVVFILHQKPQGHGYTLLEATGANPFYSPGQTVKGHEFHYSRPVITDDRGLRFVFKVKRGNGIIERKEGISKKNLLATYSHIHAGGNPGWAENFFKAALEFKEKQIFFRKMQNND